MKIRAGFVSNSSSSSFIVTIPENFVITDNIIDTIYDKCDSYYKENELNKEDVKPIIEEFIDTGSIDNYEESEKYTVIATLYRHILNEYKITFTEGGSDNPSYYQLVSIDKMKSFIEKSNNYKI
jgi:hypothetical protein